MQAVRSHLFDLLDLCVIFTRGDLWIRLDLLIVLEQSRDLKFNTSRTFHWLSGLVLYAAKILVMILVGSYSPTPLYVFIMLMNV